MRRTNWTTISTLVTMIVVTGCQDNVVSPTQQSAVVAPVAMSLAPQHPRLQLSNSASLNNSAVDFTVSPRGGTFVIGNNAVYFPANSICDPATSSYGIGKWDNACTPLRTSIRIHAVTLVKDGRTSVDFSPSLRFVPSNDPSRWVWLYMSYASTNLAPRSILYAPVMGGPAYDEAAIDPTLRTYIGVGMGVRRIKHFSGYVDTHGRWCEESPDSDMPVCN